MGYFIHVFVSYNTPLIDWLTYKTSRMFSYVDWLKKKSLDCDAALLIPIWKRFEGLKNKRRIPFVAAMLYMFVQHCCFLYLGVLDVKNKPRQDNVYDIKFSCIRLLAFFIKLHEMIKKPNKIIKNLNF